MAVDMTPASPEQEQAMKEQEAAKDLERKRLIEEWAMEQVKDMAIALEAVPHATTEQRQAIAFHSATPKFYYLEEAKKRRLVQEAITKGKKANGETGAGVSLRPGEDEAKAVVGTSPPAPAPKPDDERPASPGGKFFDYDAPDEQALPTTQQPKLLLPKTEPTIQKVAWRLFKGVDAYKWLPGKNREKVIEIIQAADNPESARAFAEFINSPPDRETFPEHISPDSALYEAINDVGPEVWNPMLLALEICDLAGKPIEKKPKSSGRRRY